MQTCFNINGNTPELNVILTNRVKIGAMTSTLDFYSEIGMKSHTDTFSGIGPIGHDITVTSTRTSLEHLFAMVLACGWMISGLRNALQPHADDYLQFIGEGQRKLLIRPEDLFHVHIITVKQILQHDVKLHPHFHCHWYCIYLRILIISYLATFLGTNSLYVLMCRRAVNQLKILRYAYIAFWMPASSVRR